MDIEKISKKYNDSRINQAKGIFAQLNIVQNLLQTHFDNAHPEITLKQFMLMMMVKQSVEFEQELTLTEYGKLLGCSRQNIKKLAIQLENKKLVTIKKSKSDPRALVIQSRKELQKYFKDVDQENIDALLLLFSVYSDSELSTFYRLLEKLHKGITLLHNQG